MKKTEEKQTNAKQVGTSQTRNPNTVLHLIAIILIAITIMLLSIGIYAWAKYTTQNAGNATAQAAKWNFKLVDGITETTNEIDFPVTRTDTNASVASGLLAPRNLWRV